MENIISVKNMCKIYGDSYKSFEALKEINLEVKEGEFIGIMGPSGSGKSTLINILSTLDQHTKGSMFIKGENINKINNQKLSEFRRNNIGFVFQNYNLLDTMTNRDNIMSPLILAKKSKKEINKRVEELAKKLDIKEILDKYPSECSGGQKQRIAIARALSNNPSIIVADEPTESLDIRRGMEFISLIKKLNLEDGITILMVTHDQLVASYCDRIVFIKDGTLDSEITREYEHGEEQVDFYKKVVALASKEVEDLFVEVKMA